MFFLSCHPRAHPLPAFQLAHEGTLMRVLPRHAEGTYAGVVERVVVEFVRRRVGELVQRLVRQQLPRLKKRKR